MKKSNKKQITIPSLLQQVQRSYSTNPYSGLSEEQFELQFGSSSRNTTTTSSSNNKSILDEVEDVIRSRKNTQKPQELKSQVQTTGGSNANKPKLEEKQGRTNETRKFKSNAPIGLPGGLTKIAMDSAFKFSNPIQDSAKEIVNTIKDTSTYVKVLPDNNGLFKSELDLKLYFDNLANDVASLKYDADIDQLNREIQQKLSERSQLEQNLLKRLQDMQGGMGAQGVAQAADKQRNEIDLAIKDLTAKRDALRLSKERERTNIQRQGTPQYVREDMLASVMLDGDKFKLTEANLHDNVNNAVEKFFGLKSINLDKARQAKQYKDEYNALKRKMAVVLDWAKNNVSLDENNMPQQVREYANELLVVNGKNLLKDQDFLKYYEQQQVVGVGETQRIVDLAAKRTKSLNEYLPDEADLKYLRNEAAVLKSEAQDRTHLHTEYKQFGSLSAGTPILDVKFGAVGGENEKGAEQSEKAFREKNAYDVAITYLDKAIERKKIDDRLKLYFKGVPVWSHFKAGVSAGVDFVTNKNTWLMDIPDAIAGSRLNHVVEKYNRGETLSSAETDALQAVQIKQLYDGAYHRMDDSKAYKWSQIGAESIKFMSEFYLTGGANSMLLSGAKGIVKAATTVAEKTTAKAMLKVAGKLTQKALTDMAIERGVEGAILQVVKGGIQQYGKTAMKYLYETGIKQALPRVLGDAAYAAFLANTAGAGRVASDAYALQNGTVNGNWDAFGNFTINSIDNQMSDAEALKTSETRNFIENFSEMLGEWNIFKGIGKAAYGTTKLAAKSVDKVIGKFGKTPRLGNFLTSVERDLAVGKFGQIRKRITDFMNSTPQLMNRLFTRLEEKGMMNSARRALQLAPITSRLATKEFMKGAQWHGFFGEVAEEYYGIILNHLMGTQEIPDDPNKSWLANTWNDMMELSVDIWGGIALSTGFLGTIRGTSNAYFRSKYKAAESNLTKIFGKEAAQMIRNSLIFSTNRDYTSTMMGLSQQLRGRNIGLHAYQTMASDAEQQRALYEYFGSLMQLRGSVYGGDFVDFGTRIREKRYRREAFNLGYEVEDYRTMQMAKQAKEVLRQQLLDLISQTNSANLVTSRLDGETRDLISDFLMTEDTPARRTTAISMLAKREQYALDDNNQELAYMIHKAILTIIAYDKAASFEDGVNTKLDEMVSAAVSKSNARIDQLQHSDGYLYHIAIPSSGETPNKERYIVGGDIHVKSGTNQIDVSKYNQNDKFVLYDIELNRYEVVPASELADSEITSMGTANEQQVESEAEIRTQYREDVDKQLSEKYNTKTGAKFETKDGKIITVLKPTNRGGIVFAISDKGKNGVSDQRVIYDEDGSKFKKLVDGDNVARLKDITDMFVKNSNYQDIQDLLDMYVDDDIIPFRNDSELTYVQDVPDGETAEEKPLVTPEAVIPPVDPKVTTPESAAEEPESTADDGDPSIPVNEHTDTLPKLPENPEPVSAEPAAPKKIFEILSDEDNLNLRQALSDLKNAVKTAARTLNSGIDPTMVIVAGSKVGYYCLKAGTKKFAQFLHFLIENVGDDVRPWTKSIYEFMRHAPNCQEYVEGMDTPEYVANFDVNGYTMQLQTDEQVVAPQQSVQQLSPASSTLDLPEPLKNSIQAVENLALENANKRLEITQLHYVIQDGSGQKRLYRRVHGVIGSRYEKSKYGVLGAYKDKTNEEIFTDYRLKLSNAALNGKDAFRSQIDTLVEDCLDNIRKYPGRKNESGYLHAKKRLENDLNLDLYLQFFDSQRDEVIFGIAQILSEKPVGPSVIRGNIWDTIGRYQLSHEKQDDLPLRYDDKRLTVSICGIPFHISATHKEVYETLNSQHISDYNITDADANRRILDEETFNIIVNNYLDIKKYFDKRNIKLVTNVTSASGEDTECLLYGTFVDGGNLVRVAGTTDIIAVHPNGDLQVIDLKTYAFDSVTAANNLSSKNYGDASTKTTSQFYQNTTKEKDLTRSQAEQYGRQTFMYTKMLASQTSGNVIDAQLIMCGVHNVPNGGKLPRFTAEDSNTGTQHSIYAEGHSELRQLQMTHLEDNEVVPNLINVGVNTIINQDVQNALSEFSKHFETVVDEKQKFNESKLSAISKLKDWIASLSAIKTDGRFSTTLSSAGSIINKINDVINDLNHGTKYTTDADIDDVTSAIELFVQAVSSQYNEAVLEFKNTQAEEVLKLKQYAYKYNGTTEHDLCDLCTLLIQDLKSHYSAISKALLERRDPSDSIGQMSQSVKDLCVILAILDKSAKKKQLNFPKTVEDLNRAYTAIMSQILNQLPKLKQVISSKLDQAVIDAINADKNLRIATIYDHTQLLNSSESAGNYTVENSTSGETRLTDVMKDPKFLDQADFYIIKSPIKEYDFAVEITHNGKTFSPVILSLDIRQIKELKDAINNATNKGLTKIRIKNKYINRTFGQIEVTEQQDTLDSRLPLMLNGSWVTPEGKRPIYNSQQKRFGLTKVSRQAGSIPKVVVTTPGQNDSSNIIYTYSGQNYRTNPSIGTLVYMYDVSYYQNGQLVTSQIPINLMSSKLRDGDINLIFDILCGAYSNINLEDLDPTLFTLMLSNAYVHNKGGNNERTSAITNMDVISMLVPFFQSKSEATTPVYISLSNKPGEIIVHTYNSEQIESEYAFDFSTVESRANAEQGFKDALSATNIRIQESILKYDFGNPAMANNMSRIQELIGDDEAILFGKSSLRFTKKQFETPTSGLEWYMSSGVLTTNFKSLSHPLINFDLNAADISSSFEIVNTGSVDSETNEDINDGEEFDYFIAQETDLGNLQKILKNNIEKNLAPILGKNNRAEIVKSIESECAEGMPLGRMLADYIELTELNLPGVEYHEAFHRIVELLIPENERQKLYNKCRNQYLLRHPEKRSISDKEVGEILAELFRAYMLGRQPLWAKGKSIYKNLIDLYDNIKSRILFYGNVGSYTLYRFYRQARTGKFANKTIIPELLERYNRVYGKEGAFMLVKLNENNPPIRTDLELRSVCKTIKHILCNPSTQSIARSGENAGHFNTDVNLLLRSPYLKIILNNPNIGYTGRLALIQCIGIKQNEDGSAVYDEENKTFVLEEGNDNYSKMESMIRRAADNIETRIIVEAQRISRAVLDGNEEEVGKEIITESDEYEPLDEEDEVGGYSAGSSALEGHGENAAEFAPTTKASKIVKMFVGNIAKRKPVKLRITSGVNAGQIKTSLVPDYENEVGLPEDWEFSKVWSLLILTLSGCSDLMHMMDTITQNAENDSTGIFYSVKNRLEVELKLAFGENWANDLRHGNAVIHDHDAYGLVTSFWNNIMLPYTDKQVALNHTRDPESEDAGSTTISSLDFLTTPRYIRSRWTGALMTGATPFVKVLPAGSKTKYEIVGKSSGNNTQYTSDARDLSDILDFLNPNKSGTLKNNSEIPVSEYKRRKQRIEGNDYNIFGEETSSIRLSDLNRSDAIHMEAVYDRLCKILQNYGIGINVIEFMSIVNDSEHGTDASDVYNFLVQNNFSQIIGIIEAFDTIDDDQIQLLWSNKKGNFLKYIDTLSKGLYEYQRKTQQRSVNTIGGKKQYLFSEPNAFVNRLLELQRVQNTDLNGQPNEDSSVFDNFVDDPYYFNKQEGVNGNTGISGSIVLKYLYEQRKAIQLGEASELNNVQFKPFYIVGFKTDASSTSGEKHMLESEQEDVISKYSALAKGDILLPTLSDKTTYGGFELTRANGERIVFGLLYNLKAQSSKHLSPTNKHVNSAYWDFIVEHRRNIRALDSSLIGYSSTYNEQLGIHEIQFPRVVLEQFLEYAKCEYNSAKCALERVRSDETDVEFFDTGNKKNQIDTNQGKKTARQCARLAQFSGMYDENGHYINFNTLKYDEENFVIPGKTQGDYMSESDNLMLAEKLFFNLNSEEQLRIINRNLSFHVNDQIEYLKSILMIELSEDGLYLNRMLDVSKLVRTAQYLISDSMENIEDHRTKMSGNSNADLSRTEKQITHQTILAYVADMSAKWLMSMNEDSRIISGNPASFKWSYDKQGRFADGTTDMFKRYGGISSTGVQNMTGVSVTIGGKLYKNGSTYRCATISTPKQKSDSSFIEKFKKDAYEQQVARAVFEELIHRDEYAKRCTISTSSDKNNPATKAMDEIRRQVYTDSTARHIGMSIEDLESKLEEMNPERLAEIRNVHKLRSSKFESIDVNDGATFITGEMAMKLLLSIGKWNADLAKAFAVLLNPDTNLNDLLTTADAWNLVHSELIGTQKYTAFGQRAVQYTRQDGSTYTVNETYYDKTALFPIFDCMATGPMLDVLNKMRNDGVDVLFMASSVKDGAKGTVNTDVDQDDFMTKKWNVIEQPMSDIRKLFNTDPNGEEYMGLGTQMMKVFASVVAMGKTYDVDGRTVEAVEMRDMIMDALNLLTELGTNEFLNQFCDKIEVEGKEPEWRLNEAKYANKMAKMFANTDESGDVAKSFDLVDGHVSVPLAALSGTNWMESIITSNSNKKIIDVISPGAAFYQRSVWAMEGLSKFTAAKKNRAKELYNNDKLSECNDAGSMDIVLSIDYFNYIFDKHRNLQNLSFAAKKAWLVKHGIISGFVEDPEGDTVLIPTMEKEIDGKRNPEYNHMIGDTMSLLEYMKTHDNLNGVTIVKWHNADTNIVGYRIPTQAISSIHAMRCVDVLPMPVHTVILPASITSITGSDFDIDKFFLSTMNYESQVDYSGLVSDEEQNTLSGIEIEKLQLERFDQLSKRDQSSRKRMSSNILDKQSKQYWVNQFIKLQISVLTSIGNDLSSLKGSIDADTIPFEEAALYIRKKEATREIRAYDIYSMSGNVQAKMHFATGKEGIGPYALNNNSHVLTMLYDVKFSDHDGVLKELSTADYDMTSLADGTDRHGKSILSQISGLINAHVDVAKDPYVFYLNINKYTYNLSNLLIRTGYGIETCWFLTQPIMLKFSRAFNTARGVYKQDETRSPLSRGNEEVNNTYYQFVNDYAQTSKNYYSTNDATVDLETAVTNRLGVKNPSLVKELRVALIASNEGVALMKRISGSNENEIKDLTFTLTANNKLYQLDFDTIQALIAIENFKLQSVAEQLSQLVLFTKIDTKKHGRTLIEQFTYEKNYLALKESSKFINLGDMLTRSFIDTKTMSAIKSTRQIAAQGQYLGTKLFLQLMQQIADRIGTTRSDLQFYSHIALMILNKIKSRYFFGDAYRDQDVTNSYCSRFGISARRLLSGTDTIHDRLLKIQAEITNQNNDKYAIFRNSKGEINNILLRKLVPYSTVTKQDLSYSYDTNMHPGVDRWTDSKFITLSGKYDDAIKDSDIQKAWEQLLDASDFEELLDFAVDLVVYAFITSADNGGSNDLFKYVPLSWREGTCKALKTKDVRLKMSYAQFHKMWLAAYQDPDHNEYGINPALSEEEIDEMVLAYAYDDKILKSTSLRRLNRFQKYNGYGQYIGGVVSGMLKLKTQPLIIGAIDSNGKLIYSGEIPRFIKFSFTAFDDKDYEYTHNARYGENQFTIYLFIGYGSKLVEKEGRLQSIKYPIYGKVQQIGGNYGAGNLIHPLGIFDTPYQTQLLFDTNMEIEFLKWFKLDLKGTFNTVGDFMNYMISPENTDPVFDDSDYNSGANISPFYTFYLDLLNANVSGQSSVKTTVSSDVVSYKKRLEIAEKRKLQFDEMNKLNLQDIEFTHPTKDNETWNRYLPVDKSTFEPGGAAEGLFDMANVKDLLKRGYHIEFYKKRYISSATNKEMFNYVATISYNGEREKGFFEIVAEIDENRTNGTDLVPTSVYSVHFKTVKKLGDQSKYASVPMTKGERRTLMSRMVLLIPVGSFITSTGRITKGGIYALQNLNKQAPKLGLLDETRPAIDEEGNSIELPIWKYYADKAVNGGRLPHIDELIKLKSTKSIIDHQRIVEEEFKNFVTNNERLDFSYDYNSNSGQQLIALEMYNFHSSIVDELSDIGVKSASNIFNELELVFGDKAKYGNMSSLYQRLVQKMRMDYLDKNIPNPC